MYVLRGRRCSGTADKAALSPSPNVHSGTMSNESNESSKVILEVGDTAPEFTLTDDKGQDVSLSDFRGRKVIVYFYPRANTPGCTKEACDFRNSLKTHQISFPDIVALTDVNVVNAS